MDENKPKKQRAKETKPRKQRAVENKPRKKRAPETKARNPKYEGMTMDERYKMRMTEKYLSKDKISLAIKARCIKHDIDAEEFKGIEEVKDLNTVVVRILKERDLDDRTIEQLLIKTKSNTKYSKISNKEDETNKLNL